MSKGPELGVVVGLCVELDVEEVEVEEVDMLACMVAAAQRTAAHLFLKCDNIEKERLELVSTEDAKGGAGKGAAVVVIEAGGDGAQCENLGEVRLEKDLIVVVIVPGWAASTANEVKKLRGVHDIGGRSHDGVC